MFVRCYVLAALARQLRKLWNSSGDGSDICSAPCISLNQPLIGCCFDGFAGTEQVQLTCPLGQARCWPRMLVGLRMNFRPSMTRATMSKCHRTWKKIDSAILNILGKCCTWVVRRLPFLEKIKHRANHSIQKRFRLERITPSYFLVFTFWPEHKRSGILLFGFSNSESVNQPIPF